MNFNQSNLKEFYFKFRSICKPPMEKFADLEIGELWFYDGLALSVTCCLGKESLLVAYDIHGPRDQAINQFLEAYNSLDDKNYRGPQDMFLVFAALEQEDGTLDGRFFSPGDWCGIPYKHPLPASNHKHPPGWE